MRRNPTIKLLAAAAALAAASVVTAGEWARWRGPAQTGASEETGLISSWSPQGENLVWRADFTGRSTPVVFDGRACAIGRTGDGINKQEVVACFDAGTGRMLWEHRFNVYHTTVPFTRVGWANIEGDPESGYLYAHGVGGLLLCLDRAGKVVWSRSLTEEFGRISGYGGRTHSPIVDEDRVILGFSNSGWGDQTAPRHRYFAFDKKTGALLWVATPGGRPETITTQATPVVAVINGTRLLIAPNGDGWIYGMKARTGEKVWGFQLAKQGLNTSVVVSGDRVYATSGDENIDQPTKGRVVCIDGTGTGDVTKTHEVWRVDELEAAFASPLIHAGRLYVVDDSANMFAIDAASGKNLWQLNLGTVGKGSPVWADGKIYATEVNGGFRIVRPEPDRGVMLDSDLLQVAGERYAEVYASPAVAYGRIYFTTEDGFYCLGDKSAPFRPTPGAIAPLPEERPASSPAATQVQIVPAESAVAPGTPLQLEARAYDPAGRLTSVPKGAWRLEGLAGTVDESGRFVADPSRGSQAGAVVFTAGQLTAAARVRAYAELPWKEDFERIEPGKSPAGWVGGATRFSAQPKDAGKALVKPFMDQGIERSTLFIGPDSMSGYTIQADLMGSRKGRKRPDMGLVAGGYTLDLMGNHQRLQIRDWVEPRLEKTIDFVWEPDAWYTMKLRVDLRGDKATIRGKVWPAGSAEPSDWTIAVDDPMPIRQGSPGLYGYSAADIFYDNIIVTRSEP